MSAAALRSGGIPGRVLAALAVALTVAFVVAPRVLAGIVPGGGFAGESDLTEAVRASFAAYWASGDGKPSPELERVVDYWFRYHLAKAAIAAILLTVLVALSLRAWRAFAEPDAPGRAKKAVLALSGAFTTSLAVFALVVVMANLQGAVAPYASLLPMLTSDDLAGVQRQLAAHPDGHASPALDTMISDFARYHAAMAVIAAIAAAALLALGVAFWKRFARTRGTARRVLGSFGALSVLLSLACIVVAAVNAATAADPVPALLAFAEGGW